MQVLLLRLILVLNYMIGRMAELGQYIDICLIKALSAYKDASDMGHSNSSLELARHARKTKTNIF